MLVQTTLARIIAVQAKSSVSTRFVQLSATTSGIGDVKEVIKIAKNDKAFFKKKTILFVDEIHRFNKTQQVNMFDHTVLFSCHYLTPATENFIVKQL